jgi:hypothetical protein
VGRTIAFRANAVRRPIRCRWAVLLCAGRDAMSVAWTGSRRCGLRYNGPGRMLAGSWDMRADIAGRELGHPSIAVANFRREIDAGNAHGRYFRVRSPARFGAVAR